MQITSRPMTVRVYLNQKGMARAESLLKCKTNTLDGEAIGGDLEKPQVVVPATGKCGAGELEVTNDLGVVVPRTSPTTTTTTP